MVQQNEDPQQTQTQTQTQTQAQNQNQNQNHQEPLADRSQTPPPAQTPTVPPGAPTKPTYIYAAPVTRLTRGGRRIYFEVYEFDDETDENDYDDE